jgi:hypothetical protein
MAESIKISELSEIASGALDDNSLLPVVDGGTTYKLPITKLKAFIGDSFATDVELSTQISSVNSTISALSTTEISEGASLYYTDARVKTKLNTEGVLSGSAQVVSSLPQGVVSGSSQITITESQISDLTHYADADVLDYLNQLEVVSGSIVTELPTGLISSSQQLPTGLVSGSSQIVPLLPQGVVSGSTQVLLEDTEGFTTFSSSVSSLADSYIGNITYVNGNLLFDGIGNAFSNSVHLPDLISSSQQIADLGFLNSVPYIGGIISGAAQIADLGIGIISGSQQITDFGFISESVAATLPNGLVSSSAQIVLTDTSYLTFDTSYVQENPGSNLYFTNDRVYDLLGPLNAYTASGGAPQGTISGSQQITDFGFISSSAILNSLNSFSASVSHSLGVINAVTASVLELTSVTLLSGSAQVEDLGFLLASSIQITTLQEFTGSEFNIFSQSLSNRLDSVELGQSTVPQGTVSGSSQVDYTFIQNKPTFTAGPGITIVQNGNDFDISGSATIPWDDITLKPVGLVSGAAQLTDDFTNESYVNTEVTNLSQSLETPFGTLRGDVEILYAIDYPTTGSNTFTGTQTINGNLNVSAGYEISTARILPTEVTGSSIFLNEAITLDAQDPLPTGQAGMLAVSSSIGGISYLYFHNGILWQEVAFV